jgi:uncharacterized lipoprotein NlpE involved in copper resistance
MQDGFLAQCREDVGLRRAMEYNGATPLLETDRAGGAHHHAQKEYAMSNSLRTLAGAAVLLLALVAGLVAAPTHALAQTPTPVAEPEADATPAAEEESAGADSPDSVDIIGYYQSDVLPAVSSPGLQIALTLYEDGTAEVESDYLNDDPPIREIGEWVQNDDGSVTLTVIGTLEQDYAEPIELTFDLEDDGALIIPGEAGGPFGAEGLRLAPADPNAVEEEPAPEATPLPEEEAAAAPAPTPVPEEEAAPETAEAAGEDAPAVPVDATTFITETTGVFISEVLPAASAPGLIIMALLYPDGAAMVSSYYLNAEPPIIEIGDWAASGATTVVITATGTLEQDYAAPTSAEFEVAEDGTLTAGNVMLARVAEAPFEPEPEPVAEDAEQGPAPVAAYQATVAAVGDSPGFEIALELFDDNSAEMVSDYGEGEAVFVDLGAWAEVDGSLVLTLTGSPEGDYVEPVELVFEAADDGTLAAVEYPVEVFGEDGLVFTPAPLESETGAAGEAEATEAAATETDATADVTADAAAPAEDAAATDAAATDAAPGDAATEDAATEATGQVFQSEVLPAASSPGRQITLALLDDGSAIMTTDYQNGEPPVTERGEWGENAIGDVMLDLTEGPQGPYDEPVAIVFAVNEDGSLTAVEYDVAVYGTEGLELAPVAAE